MDVVNDTKAVWLVVNSCMEAGKGERIRAVKEGEEK